MNMDSKISVEFHGAAGTVTGSKYLVTSSQSQVLVDCGMFQGIKNLRLQNWNPFKFDPKKIDAVLLTHAHIDHSGSLPILVKEGFEGPIFCSEPTFDLCKILLPDCGRIAEEDADYANRKGFSKHSPALPLYTEQDAFRALNRFEPVPQNGTVKIKDLKAKFQAVGHILGAACISVSNANYRVQFSGDVGRFKDMFEKSPQPAEGGNVVVMESTYGDRIHSTKDPVKEIADLVVKVFERDGVLLIPSFAVGRAQLLLYCLYQAKKRKLIPNEIPIFLDSPMATKVTNLYKQHSDWHRISEDECDDIFSIAKFVGNVKESKSLSHKTGPMVIISASGMLTGGRVLHHLKRFAIHQNNAVLLPGYQAAGTRGASLVSGARSLKIHGDYYPIHAEVVQWDILSAHADQVGLLKWLRQCKMQPQKVFLTHGEPQSSDALRRVIREEMMLDVQIPAQFEICELK